MLTFSFFSIFKLSEQTISFLNIKQQRLVLVNPVMRIDNPCKLNAVIHIWQLKQTNSELFEMSQLVLHDNFWQHRIFAGFESESLYHLPTISSFCGHTEPLFQFLKIVARTNLNHCSVG